MACSAFRLVLSLAGLLLSQAYLVAKAYYIEQPRGVANGPKWAVIATPPRGGHIFIKN